MKYEERKELILSYIKEKAGTYLNGIVPALKMNKNKVSKCISELLQEKRIIPLTDSLNPESNKVERIRKSSGVVQLVYYDEVEEKRGEMFYSKEEKPINTEVWYSFFTDDEKDPRGAKSIDTKSIDISSGLKTNHSKIK